MRKNYARLFLITNHFNMSITSIKIFPPIGIARVGNSPTDFFIGPEVPGVIDKPDGGYKDDQCRIKRQAARFRMFGYDENGDLVKEINLQDESVEFSWKVELCNKKSAYWSFNNDEAREGVALELEPRAISPRLQHLDGPLQRKRFNTAYFEHGVVRTDRPVDLGEIRTDEKSRLLVLGGLGKAGGALDNPPIQNNTANPFWYDDTSDGKVTAEVRIDGVPVDVTPAWVVVGPPDFVPEIGNAITLYDRLIHHHAENRLLPQDFPLPTNNDYRPSYTHDIYPLLKRAWIDIQQVLHINPEGIISLDFDELSQRPEAEQAEGPEEQAELQQRVDQIREARDSVIAQLQRNNGPIPRSSNQFFQDITDLQYAMLEKWQNGNFIDDWNDEHVPSISPEGLTKAALESMTGGSFFPGIEVGEQTITHPDSFVPNELFRIDVDAVKPGDLTKDLGVPWQIDYLVCREVGGGQGDNEWIERGFWPAQRPLFSFNPSTGSKSIWTGVVDTDLGMINDWHTLGFVINENGVFQDSERCEVSSITLMTPVIDFGDIHSNRSRETVLHIVFEVHFGNEERLEFVIDELPQGRHFRIPEQVIPPVERPEDGRHAQLMIPVSYVIGEEGEAHQSSVRITNTINGRERAWIVQLTGKTIGAAKNAVSLVMDASGSMTEDGGNGVSKTASARQAAIDLVDLMEDGSWLSITSFSEDASPVLDQPLIVGGDTRDAIVEAINGDGLNPRTVTSIGDGIEFGDGTYSNAPNFDDDFRKSMIIITDGRENESKYIRDVADLIKSNTYAVGIGSPENVNVTTLQNLTGNHGGYLLISGGLEGNNRFRLRKHFLQVLTSIEQKEIVYDPDGVLYPGQSVTFPFSISDLESSFDAILLSAPNSSKLLSWHLLSPNGHKIDLENMHELENVDFKQNNSMSHFKVDLPLKTSEGRVVRYGEWRAVIHHSGKKGSKAVNYSFNVHARSDLNFRAHAYQPKGDPFRFKLEASAMQHVNLPVKNASVTVEVSTSDNRIERFVLEKVGDGSYSGEYYNAKTGVHHVRFISRGTTHKGTSFQRERTLSFPVVLDDERPEPGKAWEIDLPKKVKDYRVFGRIVDAKGQGVGKLTVKAVDQDFTGENGLGRPVETDENGNYSIRYALKDFAPNGKEMNGADIILYLEDGKGETIHTTKPRRNVKKVSRIDVKLNK